MSVDTLNVAPVESWWISLLPLVIAGIVILGIMVLVFFGILVSRRLTMTMKTGGALALTVASILLLTGLWCMLLSPMSTYPETGDSFYQGISIMGFGNWSYSLNAQEGDTLFGSIGEARVYDPPGNASARTFSVHVYDPDRNVIWAETNVPQTYFNLKALRSGTFRVEVYNPNQQMVECYVQLSVTAKVTYRPLEPLGQWLSLISLPIFGLGMWASGLFATREKKRKEGQTSVYA